MAQCQRPYCEDLVISSQAANTSELEERIAALETQFHAALGEARDSGAIEALRVAYIGRSGELTQIRRLVGGLPAAEKPGAGRLINDAAQRFEAAFTAAETTLAQAGLLRELEQVIDVTLPGSAPGGGTLHPLRRTIDAIVRYFERTGFAIALGPQIETEYYNFDALNIPPDHPAREGFDSFYLDPGHVLRTHTSPMQIRMMQEHAAPIALVVPGVVFRRDAVDARHSYMFHQVEGLHVDHGIHMGHLKGALTGMCRELFGPAQEVRFRPSYFPFTEPSAEVDTTCPGCAGGGCRTCSGSGWIEIGGAGMVHPRVLQEVGYDPSQVSGWAFGVGVERIAMVRHGIDDIRVFVENDRSLMEQLG